MNVKQLRTALEHCDDDALVLLAARKRGSDHWADGDIAEIAVTAIDEKDRVVALVNCVENEDGEPIFDAPPQFKRVNANSDADKAVMRNELEDGFRSATKPLDVMVESDRMREMFALLEEAISNRSFRN